MRVETVGVVSVSNADGNYSVNPWMKNIPIQVHKPNETFEQWRTGEALQDNWAKTADEIRMIRGPIPNELFPPRMGYGDPVERTIGIRDIVNLDDRWERRDFTQYQSGMGSTSYPSLWSF